MIKQPKYRKNTWPCFTAEEIRAVTAVLKSNKVNYWTGEQARLFENEYAAAVGVNYAVAMMNGTVALEAALYALDIKEGDEVITTCRSFIASASVIVMRGATPVFADVDLDSQNITAETIKAVITPRTKAIIVVHLAGWPCDMEAIMALAKQHHLYVIEDCAQAHGATINNRQVGSWGDIAAFSFCQDKIITTGGEGGMVTTNRHEWWQKIWSMKDHGKSYDSVYNRVHTPGLFRWLCDSFGTNWRMTEMQAAIGRLQLKKLPNWLKIRRRNAAILHDVFATLPALCLPSPPANVEHAYYRYYAFICPQKLKSGWNRDTILKVIQAEKIFCQEGICGEIYQEQAFIRAYLQPKKRLANAQILRETGFALLVHPTLTEDDMYHMAQSVARVIEQVSKKDKSQHRRIAHEQHLT